MRDAAPEVLKCCLGALRASCRVTMRQHGGIHGAGRSAGDTLDPQPRLVEQPVQHAPCECAMRAAALQREVYQNGIAVIHAGGSWVGGAQTCAI
jgi:hypothetical protein